MVEGPVEFQAAGDPQAVDADEGGLDHVLAVEEIVVIHFVIGLEHPAAQGGDEDQADVVVFKADDLVFLALAVVPAHGEHRHDRVGIARGALMVPVFGEHGHLFAVHDGVGGDGHLFHDHLGLVHGSSFRRPGDGCLHSVQGEALPSKSTLRTA